MSTPFSQFSTSLPQSSFLFQHNCRSLNSKILEYRNFVRINPVPIICFSETNHHPINIPPISGYVSYSEHNIGRAKVLTYVKKTLVQIERPVHSQNPYIRAVGVDVSIGGRWIAIINTYVMTAAEVTQDDFLSLLNLSNVDEVVLTGDINAHHIAWGSSQSNLRGDTIFEATQLKGLLMANTGIPTFVRPHPPALTYIDVTFVSPHIYQNSE